MLDKVQQYLLSRLSQDKRYLLGLSGGPDSILLFHELIESGLLFSAIYVDHGMRKESHLEGKKLLEIASFYKVPLYIKKISKIDWEDGNIEEVLREKRYVCFQNIYTKIEASGLLLGHQKDDQIETVLKRVLEGGGISALGGIASESIRYGMNIYRPLLSVRKKEILDCLERKNISYFFDQTNEDERYLRARFRKTIIPQLEEDFGKSVASNIYQLGETMQKIGGYIARNIRSVTDRIIDQEIEIYLDPPFPSESIELEYVLKEMAKRAKITLSRDEIERMTEIILQKKYGKCLIRSGWKISLKKNGLFFLFSRESKNQR
jgi:tRNA(Ile)-lysidine synthase